MHGQDNDRGSHHGDQQVIGRRGNPCGGGKIRIECDGENLVIKHEKNPGRRDGQANAQPYLQRRERKDGGGAEQRGAHIARKVGRFGEYVEHEVAKRQRGDRQHGQGGIRPHGGLRAGAQEQHRTQRGSRQNHQHIRRDIQNRGGSHRPEGYVRKPVPDKGQAAQHQRNPQQGGTQRDQHARHQRIPHKGKLKIAAQHIQQAFHHTCSPPFAARKVMPAALAG